MLLTYLSSLTKVGSKREPSSPVSVWFGYWLWLKLLLMSFFGCKKFLSTCLGRAWSGTITFLAFLICSNLMCDTFLWLTLHGSWVGMNPGSFGTLDWFYIVSVSYLMCKFYRKMQGGSLGKLGPLFYITILILSYYKLYLTRPYISKFFF